MMRPFLTSLSAACCSLGILTLAQCGGSSSDAEGLAPPTIGSEVVKRQGRFHAGNRHYGCRHNASRHF